MSIYQLKTQFQNRLRPISDYLVQQGVTANQVTLSAVVLSGGVAYLVAYSAHNHRAMWLSLPVGLFIRMAMNAIDGMMAKEHQQASLLGAWLNEVGDIVSDGVLIASVSPYLVSTLSLKPIQMLTVATEIMAIFSQQIVAERANQGSLGKSDRAFELGVIGLLASMGVKINHLPALRAIFLINELLLLKTLLNRAKFIAERYFLQQYQREFQRLIADNSPFLAKNLAKNSDSFIPPFATVIPQYPPLTPLFHTDEPKPMTPQSTHPTHPTRLEQVLMEESAVTLTPASRHDIEETISCFNSYDGTAMFYRYWISKPLADIQANAKNEKIVILLHRGHEHSGRLGEMAVAFATAGYQVFAWDARGNGRSGGERDHAESFSQLVRDLDEFVGVVKAQTFTDTENILLVASSLGAVIASSWVHDYAPTVRGMILGTPAFAIRLYVPFAMPALKAAKKLGLVNRVSSYVKAKVLTHDSEAQQAYSDDPLISSSISRDLLIDSLATGQRLLDDAGAVTTPTMILCAGKDYVVDKEKIRDFYEQIRSPIKRWHLYPNSYHAIFHEINKDQVFDDCLRFADKIFAQPVTVVDLQHADQPISHADSYSKDRVDRLAVKGFNPQFALTKLMIQKFGYISEGVAIGIKHGFDSGTSLEKVYQNQANGVNALGKLVDGFYLNNIGWQGIRIRKTHLLELGKMAITRLQKQGMSHIHAFDIASGNGYYMFELCQLTPHLYAELRDYDSHNVSIMGEKAHYLSLDNRVKVVQQDAFDPTSYAKKGEFQLAVASGVFELFSDNSLIKTAIDGIFSQLSVGGYFIYTNQPYHPEQEFIGKTLNNHQGKDWIMRCRSQAEIDQLVTQAGFEKVSMRIDKFGIFTVSLAVKK